MTSKWDEETIRGLSGKLDAKDAANMLPIHHALKQKAPLAAINLLVKGYGDGLTVKDLDGKLPIHYAAEKNLSSDYFQILLNGYSRGLREKDDHGMLPFHHLIRFCQDLDLLQLCLSIYPESIRERDRDGWLPLHFAARDNSSKEVIELLVVRYAGGLCEKSVHGSLPIHCAAHFNNNTDVLKYLADQFPDSLFLGGNKGMWPIHCAARNNPSMAIMKLLIALHPTSICAEDEDGRLPLHHSIRNISLGIVKYLLDLYPAALRHGDGNGWLPIHTAARFSMNVEIISCLHSYYPESLQILDEEEWLPLHHAARNNHSLEVIKYFIQHYPEGLLCKAFSVDKYAHELAAENSDKRVFLALLFLALNREGVQSMGVVRMHLIGDGYAGKTVCSKWISQLIHLNMLNWQTLDLFDSAVDVPAAEGRTRGMETTRLTHSLTLTDNRTTHYLIHDYAGQQEYLLNHAIFLNQSDSLYILVLPLYDKVRKVRNSTERLIDRTLFWLRFLYSSVHQRYCRSSEDEENGSGGIEGLRGGIPICLVLNTFEIETHLSEDDLQAVKRKIMTEVRKSFTLQTFQDYKAQGEDKPDGAGSQWFRNLSASLSASTTPAASSGGKRRNRKKRSADFILLGNDLLVVDARMKFSVQALIDALKAGAAHHIDHSLSRESKLQAYCWDLVNMLDLSIVMREEDLQFMVTSTIKSFFSKQLQAFLIAQQASASSTAGGLSEEDSQRLALLKEMQKRPHIVDEVEALLSSYILEILQTLGKIFVVPQQRQKYLLHAQEDEIATLEADHIVITSPHDLSHTILGYLYGNLRSFTGKNNRDPFDLILTSQQIKLLLTYLPVLPITIPRLLVLLGVCIPVWYKRTQQEVSGVYDPPQFNPAYLHPPPPSTASQSGSSVYVEAYNRSNSSATLPSSAPALPSAQQLTTAMNQEKVEEEEKCYWAIGLIPKSITEETDFSRTRLLAQMTHVVTRVFCLVDKKRCELVPGFFPKLFVFLNDLEPSSLALNVYKDGFNLISKVELTAKKRTKKQQEVEDAPTLPPPAPPVPPAPPSPSSADEPLAEEATTPPPIPAVLPVEDIDGNADEPAASSSELSQSLQKKTDELEQESIEVEETIQVKEYLKQFLVLPYRDEDRVGFQITVATNLPYRPYTGIDTATAFANVEEEEATESKTSSPPDLPEQQQEEEEESTEISNYCLSTMMKVRHYLQTEMWGIELQEFCLASPMFLLDAPAVMEGEEAGSTSLLGEEEAMRQLPENKFYRSHLYHNLYASPAVSGLDLLLVEEVETAWLTGSGERTRLREQLFGYLEEDATIKKEQEQQVLEEDGRLVYLRCKLSRRPPLLAPYSTFSKAIDEMSRAMLLSCKSVWKEKQVQEELLQRIRCLGLTRSPLESLFKPVIHGKGRAFLDALDDLLAVSRDQMRTMAQQVRDRLEALAQGPEAKALAVRDLSDFPLLPLLTRCEKRGSTGLVEHSFSSSPESEEQQEEQNEEKVELYDYRVHFLCPVCGAAAASGRDGQGYRLPLAAGRLSEEMLQVLAMLLATCEGLVNMAQSALVVCGEGASGGLLGFGAALQDCMDLFLQQSQRLSPKDRKKFLITPERVHRLQTNLFHLMKDFLLCQADKGDEGGETTGSDNGRRARQGLDNLGQPLVAEEEQHLLADLRADVLYSKGLVDLLVAVDDPYLLHCGLARVVHSSGSVAWVCAPVSRAGNQSSLSVQNVGQGLGQVSTGPARSLDGSVGGGGEVGLGKRSGRRARLRTSSCQEEFLRRGREALVIKLKY
eukprot:gene3503-3837_t